MQNLFVIICMLAFAHVQVFAQDTTHVSVDSLQNKSSINPDSMKTEKASKFAWKLFYPFEFGIGYGSRSNVGFGNPGPGLVLSLDFLSFGLGFKSLNDFGIGTAVVEIMATSTNAPEYADDSFSSAGLPFSWFPVYAYYPLYSKRVIKINDSQKTRVRSPFVYAFAGGSGWAKQNNYLHAGIGAIIATFEYIETPDYYPPPTIAAAIGRALAKAFLKAFPILNFSAQAGMFYSSGYEANNGMQVNGDVGFYVTLKMGMGAAF